VPPIGLAARYVCSVGSPTVANAFASGKATRIVDAMTKRTAERKSFKRVLQYVVRFPQLLAQPRTLDAVYGGVRFCGTENSRT
jgi:hypothetical protein